MGILFGLSKMTHGFVWKCWVYSQWNSRLIGIMISKTIGFRGTLFSDTPTLRNWNQSRFWWLSSLFQGKMNWCDRWEECDDYVFSSLFERHLWLNWIDVSFSHVRKQNIYTPVINLYHHNSLRHQMLNHILFISNFPGPLADICTDHISR